MLQQAYRAASRPCRRPYPGRISSRLPTDCVSSTGNTRNGVPETDLASVIANFDLGERRTSMRRRGHAACVRMPDLLADRIPRVPRSSASISGVPRPGASRAEEAGRSCRLHRRSVAVVSWTLDYAGKRRYSPTSSSSAQASRVRTVARDLSRVELRVADPRSGRRPDFGDESSGATRR